MPRENPYSLYPDPSDPSEQAPRRGLGKLGARERAVPPANGLAMAGFGLAFLGPLALIGVVLCLIALRRPPRGFAIVGLAIGLVMSLLTLICGGLMGLGLWAMNEVEPQFEEIQSDYQAIGRAVSDYKAAHDGALPPDLDALDLTPDQRLDPYGHAYTLDDRPDGGWSLGFAGVDGVYDSDDDVRLRDGLTAIDPEMAEVREALTKGILSEKLGVH